jgi:cytochrome c556
VKWAHDAQLAANETAEAAKSNDLEKAGMSAKRIGATCGPCHSAHREKLEAGGYMMK